jgi:hypothetical protein
MTAASRSFDTDTFTMPPPVFAFLEDGTLRLFETTTAAALEYEGIDVESGVVKFYDRSGTYLQPVFSSPNRTGKIFGLFSWVQSGVYALSPNTDAGEDPFAVALLEVSVLEPNPWFSTLEELKSTLAAEGVEVEWRGDRAAES